MSAHTGQSHRWLQLLTTSLDALERSLLTNDAIGVERASAQVQSVLQQAPRPADLRLAAPEVMTEVEAASVRFGRLRQAVLQMSARSQRGVETLFPQTAPETYGVRTGGTGRNYHLSA